MIEDDEIMSELRQIRAEMLAKHGSDPEARYRMLKALEAEEARKGRRIVSLPARQSTPRVPDPEPRPVPG
jgi:regulator of RNase E activity RraB